MRGLGIFSPGMPHTHTHTNLRCQDENRHGDFLAAVLKAKPGLLKGLEASLWSRFFCLSVYVTMYLNDHTRTKFYESLGMNTRQFDQHVIRMTNESSERLFPQVKRRRQAPVLRVQAFHAGCCTCHCAVQQRTHQRTCFSLAPLCLSLCLPCLTLSPSVFPCQVPDVDAPGFWDKMNYLVEMNTKVCSIDNMDVPSWVKSTLKAPFLERMLATCVQVSVGLGLLWVWCGGFTSPVCFWRGGSGLWGGCGWFSFRAFC